MRQPRLSLDEHTVTVLRACCEARLSLLETAEELDNAHIRPPRGQPWSPDKIRQALPKLPVGLEHKIVKYWSPTQVKRAIESCGLVRENRRELPWLTRRK